VLLVGERAALKGDAAEAARRWQGPITPAAPEGMADTDIVVDALFGAGLNRPVDGLSAAMINAMNKCGAPVLPVDLPSGINGTTGALMSVAVKADATVTFFRRKPGHLLLPGRLYCGKVTVADIGINARVLASVRPQVFANGPTLWGEGFPF